MNARENFISLYRRRGYDFAPVEFGLCPALHAKMEQAIGKGVDAADYFGYPHGFARAWMPGPAQCVREPVDWRARYPRALDPDTHFNEYGVAHEGGSAGTFHMRRMHHPLAGATSLAEIEDHPWPAWDFDDLTAMRAAAEKGHAEGKPVVAYMQCTVWETAWYIRDMTVLMADMYDDDPKATFILDRVTADSARRAAAYARAGADLISLGDDIGMQSSIMMSLDMYRRWLKPRLAQVIAAARRENPDVIIHYHSCGYVEPFIPDLIEAGLDVLNPVQPECMDFARLHAQYGDRLSFNGTIGTQTTMPFGTPDEVRATVHRNLDIAGPRGGLLAAPTHLLEPEVPWENVAAYVLACKEYGR